MAESEQGTFRLSPELRAKIDALAAEERRSFGAVVRILVEEAIAAREGRSDRAAGRG